MLGTKNRLVDDGIWNDLIREADVDGNGEIDYEEFKVMMEKLIDKDVGRHFTVSQSNKSTKI